MSQRHNIVIGTRGSALARKQADIATHALLAVDPTLEIELRIITPRGDIDKNTPIPLDTIGKGWFSQEIEQELRDGTIDLAVHSLKDMLTELPETLTIGAYLKREDARDVLLTKDGRPLEELRAGAVIGTDSTRRQVQMLEIRPDVVMKSVRGNVPNRVQKLQDEDYDAIILAAAGLIRLGLQDKIVRYFEPSEMTPSPGQGTIAVEIRSGNTDLLKILSLANDADAQTGSILERTFSELIGGGCKSPTGAYAWREAGSWNLIGMAQHQDGTIVRETLSAPENSSSNLGYQLAQSILKRIG